MESKRRQCLSNREVWNFFKLAKPTPKRPTKHPRPPDYRPQLTSPLTLSYSSAITIPRFFGKLQLKLSKVRFILSALHPLKPTMKDDGF